MFLCSLIEELCTKKENDKTGCNFNFGHECIYIIFNLRTIEFSFGKKSIFSQIIHH